MVRHNGPPSSGFCSDVILKTLPPFCVFIFIYSLRKKKVLKFLETQLGLTKCYMKYASLGMIGTHSYLFKKGLPQSRIYCENSFDAIYPLNLGDFPVLHFQLSIASPNSAVIAIKINFCKPASIGSSCRLTEPQSAFLIVMQCFSVATCCFLAAI